jgi:hypothetical protein
MLDAHYHSGMARQQFLDVESREFMRLMISRPLMKE